MKNEFKKRVFSPATLVQLTIDILKSASSIRDTLQSSRIAPAFRERLWLTVTSVNQCRYCQWMHSDLASANGVSKEQIGALLGSAIQAVPDEEQLALSYALHYAESNRQPSAIEKKRLIEKYGQALAQDIENWMLIIFFSNLSGNTFDSFLSRLRGEPAPGGNIAFEALFAILSAPVLLTVAAATKNSVNPLMSMAQAK